MAQAKYSKLGYGNAEDVEAAIALGMLDGRDITADERAAWNAKPTQDELAAAKNEAISTAAADATTKADAALASAKTYADGLNTTMDGRVQVLEGAITWKSLDG